MTLALAFWIGMFIWLILGVWSARSNLLQLGPILGLQFVLMLILGWHAFGPPKHPTLSVTRTCSCQCTSPACSRLSWSGQCYGPELCDNA